MKRKPEKEPNHERWLLTYSDLITLLMIFFIVLYAMSNIDKEKFQTMANSFNITMGGGKIIATNSIETSSSDNPTPIIPTSPTEEEKLNTMKGTLDKYIKDENLSDHLSTIIEEKGLVITLKDTLLFDTSKSDVKDDAKTQLIKLGSILNKIPNYIRIEGHTDNIPIHSNKFNSNWQLSVIRATEVTELLITKSGIDPKRISAVGYGEFRPIADNKTEAGRAKNRRVNIVILDNKFNNTENDKKK